jgi:photosystem II stability/assembly factor-like uncharacterized protein
MFSFSGSSRKGWVLPPRFSRRSTDYSQALRLEALEDRSLLSVTIYSNTWTAIGPAPLVNGSISGSPAESGRISALAADPTNPNIIYIAAAGGGVWKTLDGGTTWKPLTDKQPIQFMGAIALAPSNPSVIYAGTGEANLGPSKLAIARDNIYYGFGVLKSTDGGTTWSLLGKTEFYRRAISKIVVDPKDPNTVYVAVGAVATNGLPGNTGIWKSTDGGTTWKNTTASISTTAAFSDVAMSPSNSQVLFAAVGDPFGDAANGLYLTSDGGAHWAPAGDFPKGASDSNVGRVTVAIAKTNAQVLYASIAQSGAHSVLYKMLKSANGGATWTLLTKTPDYMGSFGDYNTSLAVDPSNANIIYAGGQAGLNSLVRSMDGGNTWATIARGSGSPPHADHHAAGFDANGKFLDGNDGGIWRLDDASPANLLWSDLNGNLDTIQFSGIALNPTDPGIAYGGSQDNGVEKFQNSPQWTRIVDSDGGFVIDSFTNPQTVYYDGPVASFGASAFVERSLDGGQSFTSITNGINGNEPTNFFPPLVMNASNASRLLLGTDRVYETQNGGDLWKPISTPGMNGWTVSTAIDAIATSKSNPNTIYATSKGHVFVTTDDGMHWTERDIPGFSDHFHDVEIDPTNSQVAYIVRDRFTPASQTGHVFVTHNGGMTWKDISGNLPNSPTNALALDPRTNVIYVGDDLGVYASIDGGASWSRFKPGFPIAQVVQLQLNPSLNILAAGTHGRGMWEIALAHFQLTPAHSSEPSGNPFSVMVTAEDPFNRTLTSYTGAVHLVSTDHSATLMDFTFAAADNGTHTVSVTLRSTGNQIIRVSDVTESGVTGAVTVTVTPPGFAVLSNVADANSPEASWTNLSPFDLDRLFASVRLAASGWSRKLWAAD